MLKAKTVTNFVAAGFRIVFNPLPLMSVDVINPKKLAGKCNISVHVKIVPACSLKLVLACQDKKSI